MSEGAFWACVSDHRPLVADFIIGGGVREGSQPLPPKPKHKLVQPELLNPGQLETLHTAHDLWLVNNPAKPNVTDEEIG